MWHKLSFSAIPLPFLVDFLSLLFHFVHDVVFEEQSLSDKVWCLTLREKCPNTESFQEYKNTGNHGETSFFVQWHKKKQQFLLIHFGETLWRRRYYVWTRGIWFRSILHDQNKYNHCSLHMITAYFNQLDLAKYCGLTSDDIWETS